MDNIPLCTADDYPRFVEIINKAIEEKRVKKYKKYNSDYKDAMKARKEFEEKEKKKFEKAQAKEKKNKNKENKNTNSNKKDQKKNDGKESLDELALILQNNRKRRLDNTLNSILEKYGKEEETKSKSRGKKQKKSNKKASKMAFPDEPSEEEFLKLQEKLFGKK